ncbi:MAG TPA: resistance to Congo red protein [Solirubrobacteraceae bacterium]|nr:resistance to Congo red protein [Solirubrobacteraceae bacterium]
MAEGLSASEVGKEIGEHRRHGARTAVDRHDRLLSIAEALLLSVVAVLAAYSGYAAAKWSTESSVTLAKASALRTKANRADLEALQIGTLDSVSFNAWFSAFSAGNQNAERLAERRLRPGYRPAFQAWLATDPAHNSAAPPGPSYMPQYVIPQETYAPVYDAQADAAVTRGSEAGATADKYVRGTVFLATVLFLVGISSHFALRQARYALVGVGSLILVFSVIQLLGLPGPPA